MLCFVLSACHQQGAEVKSGQIWIKEYDAGYPVEQLENDTILILSVHGKYCHYKKRDKVYSEKCFWIPVSARRIK